jgi:hypothetical protein
MEETRVQRGRFEPGAVLRAEINVYEGREAEREVGARKLGAIGLNELRPCIEGYVVERIWRADMHVGINESRDEIPLAAIDPTRTGGSTEI